MSSEKKRIRERSIDRREFFGIAMKSAAALAALPAASMVLTACGGGEERGEPAAPASPPARPSEAPSPPPAETPPTPAPAQPPSAAGNAGDELVTEIAAVSSMVTALQYVNQSPKPEQKCANCQLYTAGSGGRGKCQLFTQGLVKETGWCASWVARVS